MSCIFFCILFPVSCLVLTTTLIGCVDEASYTSSSLRLCQMLTPQPIAHSSTLPDPGTMHENSFCLIWIANIFGDHHISCRGNRYCIFYRYFFSDAHSAVPACLLIKGNQGNDPQFQQPPNRHSFARQSPDLQVREGRKSNLHAGPWLLVGVCVLPLGSRGTGWKKWSGRCKIIKLVVFYCGNANNKPWA